MSPSDRPNRPGNDPLRDLNAAGGDSSRRPAEPTRPLRLPDDVAFEAVEADTDDVEDEDDDSEVIYLDDDNEWALLLPEGAVLHAHGTAEDDDEEAIFYECEPAEDDDGEPLLRCTECGATITEAEVADLITALDEEAE